MHYLERKCNLMHPDVHAKSVSGSAEKSWWEFGLQLLFFGFIDTPNT